MDLNYANPAVFVDIDQKYSASGKSGCGSVPLDAVPYILEAAWHDLPQFYLRYIPFVRMLRMVLECVCPAVILKGEVVMAPKELAAYFGTPEKPECHMLYNVSTMVNLWVPWQAVTPAC